MTNPIGVRLTKGVALSTEIEQLNGWYKWLKETGFDVVDVPNLTLEVKQGLENHGMTVGTFDGVSVPSLFSRDESKRNTSIENVRKQFAEAAQLGGKTCFMCLKPEDNTMSRQESFSLFKEVFPILVKDAEQLGTKIVLEGWPGPAPHYPTLGCTPEVLRAMFEAVPSPALCINFDPSHLFRLGIDYVRFLREFRSRIGHVHAKDCKFLPENVYLYGRNQASAFGQPIKFSEGPWRYTIPGEGEIDWAQVAFELESAEYTGPVCVELEDYRYSGSVVDHRKGLAKTLNFLNLYFR